MARRSAKRPSPNRRILVLPLSQNALVLITHSSYICNQSRDQFPCLGSFKFVQAVMVSWLQWKGRILRAVMGGGKVDPSGFMCTTPHALPKSRGASLLTAPRQRGYATSRRRRRAPWRHLAAPRASAQADSGTTPCRWPQRRRTPWPGPGPFASTAGCAAPRRRFSAPAPPPPPATWAADNAVCVIGEARELNEKRACTVEVCSR